MLAWVLGLFLLWGSSSLSSTEQSDSVTQISRDSTVDRVLFVDRIIVIGNKVTKRRIIDRELSLMPGDTVRASMLLGILQWDKNKLYNLRLFNTVSVRALDMTNNHIDILIELTERWYIFPAPIFELSDRNFSEWWNNYNHDLDRINYGVRLYKNNFRGRNETLRLTAQFGFYRKFDLVYRIPNLDKKQKQGLAFGLDYNAPKNLAYYTDEHKLVYLQGKQTLRTSFGANITYSYRKTFFETHSLTVAFRESEVKDTLLLLNPIYYSNSKTSQKYFTLSYSFNSEHRDVVLYPLKGYQFSGYIAQNGILPTDDVNQLEINMTYARHWPLGKNVFLSNFTSGLWSTPQNQSYSVFNTLGYRSQLIRGYENYVVEGPQFALNKTTLKKRIFSKAWTMNSMPIEQFNYFPLSIYIKAFADFGYVQNYQYYNENNLNQLLSNKLLSGGGFGLDMVTAYDLVLRFEVTFTSQRPDGAFFFNVRKEF